MPIRSSNNKNNSNEKRKKLCVKRKIFSMWADSRISLLPVRWAWALLMQIPCNASQIHHKPPFGQTESIVQLQFRIEFLFIISKNFDLFFLVAVVHSFCILNTRAFVIMHWILNMFLMMSFRSLVYVFILRPPRLRDLQNVIANNPKIRSV